MWEFIKWLAEKFIEWLINNKNWKLVTGFLVGVLSIIIVLKLKFNVNGIPILAYCQDCHETSEMQQLTSVAQKIYLYYRTDQLEEAEKEYRVNDFKRAAEIFHKISKECEKNICNTIQLKINSDILKDANKLFDEKDWKKSCDTFRSFFSTLTEVISNGN